jgi:hypothetical protein
MGSSVARDDQSQIQDVTQSADECEPSSEDSHRQGGRNTLDEKGSQLPLQPSRQDSIINRLKTPTHRSISPIGRLRPSRIRGWKNRKKFWFY